jgi:TolA-binding protein
VAYDPRFESCSLFCGQTRRFARPTRAALLDARRWNRAATQAKADTLKAKINELSADLDKLQRLTRELEENNRQEARLYERLKKQKDGEGGREAIVADVEQRAKTADQQTADAGARLDRLKAAAAKMSL